ncbi:carbonic anhydrase [Nocardioides sp.]|uniref:beta-class carbonic anhydrase n=1 Tax=Nocardioides sp. TaxID=35761 RepID=UPI00271E3C73|nr:carbonic anhydrase [Nocardioides sp.]MDO9456045.1 carbonic anhydrase [Nocardioides sp.]
MPDFDDLLGANQEYAAGFTQSGLDGVARRGIAVVTCMDSRIDPLGMLGLAPGDAKILRNPGGRVDHLTLEALVLAVHLLGVTRVVIAPHTNCAVASSTEAELRSRIEESAGMDASWQSIHVVRDQLDSLADDVQKVRTHPLVPTSVAVGGFIYDVHTGRLERQF